MPHFDYHKVFTYKEAYDAVSGSNGSAYFLAGGTDLLVKINAGVLQPLRVIDMKGIPQMEGLSVTENIMSIGALSTIRTLETSSDVNKRFPLLAQAAAKLGSVQVRNRATVGGNLCNAAPSAEMAPALLALDAQVEIYGKEGLKMVDLEDFFSGPGLTILKEGEILTCLKIPLNSEKRWGGIYNKLTNRNAMDIAFVGVAVLLQIEKDDRISKARIALGAVAPTPVRAKAAERMLEGKLLSDELIQESAELATTFTNPISDLRASAEYRKEMVNILCQKGLQAAFSQALSFKEGETE